MTMVPNPLANADLLAHARAAAHADERRHNATSAGTSPSQRNEQTLRGWGGAALLDLEWTSQYVYGKVEKTLYRAEYATEYLRLREERAALASAAAPAAV